MKLVIPNLVSLGSIVAVASIPFTMSHGLPLDGFVDVNDPRFIQAQTSGVSERFGPLPEGHFWEEVVTHETVTEVVARQEQVTDRLDSGAGQGSCRSYTGGACQVHEVTPWVNPDNDFFSWHVPDSDAAWVSSYAGDGIAPVFSSFYDEVIPDYARDPTKVPYYYTDFLANLNNAFMVLTDTFVVGNSGGDLDLSVWADNGVRVFLTGPDRIRQEIFGTLAACVTGSVHCDESIPQEVVSHIKPHGRIFSVDDLVGGAYNLDFHVFQGGFDGVAHDVLRGCNTSRDGRLDPCDNEQNLTSNPEGLLYTGAATSTSRFYESVSTTISDTTYYIRGDGAPTTEVPIPASLPLMVLGLGGLLGAAKLRRR